MCVCVCTSVCEFKCSAYRDFLSPPHMQKHKHTHTGKVNFPRCSMKETCVLLYFPLHSVDSVNTSQHSWKQTQQGPEGKISPPKLICDTWFISVEYLFSLSSRCPRRAMTKSFWPKTWGRDNLRFCWELKVASKLLGIASCLTSSPFHWNNMNLEVCTTHHVSELAAESSSQYKLSHFQVYKV